MLHRMVIMTLLVLFMAAPAHSYVEWDIHCNGAQTDFEGTVGVFNQYIQEGDVSGYDLLFEELAIGTCDTPEVFMTVPLQEPFTYAQYPISRPVVETGQNYRFRVLLRHPDGMVQDIGFPGAPSWNAVSCGEAVAARGFLVGVDQNGVAELGPCPDSCDTWPCVAGIDLTMIPEEHWLPLVGTDTAVDIYGTYVLYPMAGSPCMYGESLSPVLTGECGPVGVQEATWSGVKAWYR